MVIDAVCRRFTFFLVLFINTHLHAASLRHEVATFAKDAREKGTRSGSSRREVPANTVYQTRFPNVTWDNDAWQLSTTMLDQGHYQSRMGIANGYLGLNVAALGPFFEVDTPVDGDEINGWPLFGRRQTFATISGFFDEQPTTNGTNFEWLNQYGGESVISGVPHWGGLVVDLGNGQYLDANADQNTISNFSTTLDAKAGVMMWHFTWTPGISAGPSFAVDYTAFANKLFVKQGIVQLQIRPSHDCNVSIVNVFDGTSAVRTDFVESGMDSQQIYTAVKPTGISNVTAYLYAALQGSSEVDFSTLALASDKPYVGSNDSSIAQAVNASLKMGQTTTVTKYVGGATSDGFSDPQDQAKNASLKALETGYLQSLIFHVAEWAIVMPDDSVDDYTYPENGTLPSGPDLIESAITAVVNPYYLLQNTISEDAIANVSNAPIDGNSISVGGLVSDSYAGLVFWDADFWMQPGLVVAFPGAAKQISKYRYQRYGQARANAQTAYTSSKNDTAFSSHAAAYSWTSGRYGNCTSTGPCFDYEYHINGDIARGFSNYLIASGDSQTFEEFLLPVYDSIATFYSELLSKNGSFYVLTNMTDPDEYANNVDNGGYTMILIEDILTNANVFRDMFGLERNSTFEDQAANVFISRNQQADIIEEYTGMNGSIEVKQADVVLVTSPLDYKRNYTSQNSRDDLSYYAGKQSPDGPGMTFSTFSIVASQVAIEGCAGYTYQQYSEQPYARAPWFQFSEQLVDDYMANGGTHPAFPFLTGHGGANQVTVFGYLGLNLLPDFILHVNPSLPPQIPNLKYRTIYWQGWPISATSNQTHTTLTRLSQPYMTANLTYASTSIPVLVGSDNPTMYQLPPNGSITLINRAISNATQVAGNIAQCRPVASPDGFQPGQFPLSAVDGTASTKWQPQQANISQSISVFLGSGVFQPVTGFFFDWAQNAPTNISVHFHNTSVLDANALTVLELSNIVISDPYNATQVNIITPYMSNTTNVTLEVPKYSGEYATLSIQGNQGDPSTNATGASVAEWAIITG